MPKHTIDIDSNSTLPHPKPHIPFIRIRSISLMSPQPLPIPRPSRIMTSLPGSAVGCAPTAHPAVETGGSQGSLGEFGCAAGAFHFGVLWGFLLVPGINECERD